jgi:hypothetical protein
MEEGANVLATEAITLTASILGITFGAVGLAVSILNYLRDRARVNVLLEWDLSVTPNPKYDPGKKWGSITVANVGRRPVFVTKVALMMPKGAEPRFMLIMDSMPGRRLSEGDQPQVSMVSQDDMRKVARYWNRIRAVAYDSAGKEYRSNPVAERPSWAS